MGVEAAENLGGVAEDLELVPGANVGGDVSDLPVGHSEARHVLLRKRLPPRREAAVEDSEVARARRARVDFDVLGHDVVHQLGHAHDRLVQLGLEVRAPVRRPPLLVAGPLLAPTPDHGLRARQLRAPRLGPRLDTDNGQRAQKKARMMTGPSYALSAAHRRPTYSCGSPSCP